jgi:hypothetical protein
MPELPSSPDLPKDGSQIRTNPRRASGLLEQCHARRARDRPFSTWWLHSRVPGDGFRYLAYMIESAEQFRSLRESEQSDEYSRAAHEEAPLEVWLDVIERMPDMRFWVAQNKTVPIPVLEHLADDIDPRVRDMVARKRKLPESLQTKLATDPDPSVRCALASNAKLAPRALVILSNDLDEMVAAVLKRRAENAK